MLHFNAVNSFTAIINVETEVLKEKFSISSCTFLIVLCKTFNSSLVAISSETSKLSPLKYNFHNFFKKDETPEIPEVFQGLVCSKGPKNISNILKASAPYSATISSGFTTLYFDLDIFSTSLETTYFSSLKIK